MDILNSPTFRFFKKLEKNIESFYYRTVKGNFSRLKLKWKIRKMMRRTPRKPLSKAQKQEIKAFYKKHGIKSISISWHEFYSDCNRNFSSGYVPEDLFYLKIEPALNATLFFPALSDKNLIDKLFTKVKQPEIILKNSNGFFYHDNKLIDYDEALDCCNISEKMIIKPTIDSWGGKNVHMFAGPDDNSNQQSVADLFEVYQQNFIVQKVVEQHFEMSQLNSTSLNTFRVMTFLEGKAVKVLSVVVRIGRKGSITDNATSGGISCGVKPDGQLNETGFDISGKPITVTDDGMNLKDIQLSFIDKVKDVAQTLHVDLPYFKIISWDLALDVNGEVILIEHNDFGQEINFHQLNNGAVLTPLVEAYAKQKQCSSFYSNWKA